MCLFSATRHDIHARTPRSAAGSLAITESGRIPRTLTAGLLHIADSVFLAALEAHMAPAVHISRI